MYVKYVHVRVPAFCGLLSFSYVCDIYGALFLCYFPRILEYCVGEGCSLGMEGHAVHLLLHVVFYFLLCIQNRHINILSELQCTVCFPNSFDFWEQEILG